MFSGLLFVEGGIGLSTGFRVTVEVVWDSIIKEGLTGSGVGGVGGVGTSGATTGGVGGVGTSGTTGSGAGASTENRGRITPRSPDCCPQVL